MRHRPLAFVCCALFLGCGTPPGGGGEGGPLLDLSMAPGPGADLVMVSGCAASCGGLTPICSPRGHCVGCVKDADCPIGQACNVVSDTQASCRIGCTDDTRCGAGKKCCNKSCVDVSSDIANCGACGTVCMANHATPVCMAGVCGFSGMCAPGWGDCNKDPKDGCEANLHTDPNNCTACGMACNIMGAVAGCADGCYAAACNFGYANCMNDPTGACQTSVLSDISNCGGCGTSCKNLPNATAQCQNASCVLGSCNNGFADCDHMAQNGCEANVATDGNNCGGCGNVCPQGEVCMGGACTCPKCNNAFPNASANCVNGQCVFGQCNLGYANCDGNIANGCEVNINGDPANCGACGKACPNNMVCGSGMCTTCGNDCWSNAGCLTAQGHCIQFTCRAGSAKADFCNGCLGWKEVTYQQWMNGGYCADVIARYRISDQMQTHCGGNGASCCMGQGKCGGGDNAWHFNDGMNNYYTGPCLGCANDVNCKYWNNVDNSGYTRITVCEK